MSEVQIFKVPITELKEKTGDINLNVIYSDIFKFKNF